MIGSLRVSMTLVIVIAFVLIGAVQATGGVDDEGNPNDPLVNARANACYDGGSMAEKCDLAWEWTCGWYIIRIETDVLPVEALPVYCNSLIVQAIPDITLPETTDTFPGCVNTGSGYVDFGNSRILMSPYALFRDDTCLGLGKLYEGGIALVYAFEEREALRLCQSLATSVVLIGQYDNVWSCDNGLFLDG